ncbi:MAG: hypothetical protein Q9162_007969 [Coniocarpon cinnabarinum]
MQENPLSVVTSALNGDGPSEWIQTAALPFTSNPWKLAWNDVLLFFYELRYLPIVVSPVFRFNSGHLDELYPSAANLFCVATHVVLSICQIAFLLSLPLFLIWPAPFGVATLAVFAASFIFANKLLCDWLLNGSEATIESKVDLSCFPKHDEEQWIFLNGVAVGSHWLQSNVDRLALSFGRRVLGVHNPTTSVVFDVLQCLIQRDFSFATQDVRNAYGEIKKALARPATSKVVFIVHSQGGIEGSLILDWLYADVPGVLLKKLEVYTFGNAANHFNDPEHAPDDYQPGKGLTPVDDDPALRVVRHIEHYANSTDFVSRWGVLFFASQRAGKNRYRGRIYECNRAGHLLNQHYLDEMFPLDEDTGIGLAENNPFMSTAVEVAANAKPVQDANITEAKQSKRRHKRREHMRSPTGKVVVRNLTCLTDADPTSHVPQEHLTVGKLSRLWTYRNGLTPPD